MAALQKTWSGDLTEEIAGRILSAINNYEEEEKLKEASPKVKQAARELRKEDSDVKKVQSPSTAIVVKQALLPVHIKVEQLDKEVKKISGKVTAIGTGLADTTKLIGDQNAMLEVKFDIMLGLLRARGAGEEEIKDGVTGGGGISGTGAIVPVSKNFGDRAAGFLGKKYASQILRRTSKFLRRKIIPRRLRAGARLLRMKGKKFLRPITRQLSKVRPKNLMRAGAQRFVRSGIGKKITKKLGTKALTKIGGKALGKAAAKKIPIAGAVFGSIFAIQRAMQGDWTGAGLELASGVASIFPGVGTGISVALDAGLAARDIHKAVKSDTPAVPEREMGSGTDVMGMFKQASSLLLSSMMPIAASAGTLPEVKGQIKAAGLDGVEIARMQPPTGINIGRGGKKVSLPAPPEPTVAKIPPLPKLPGVGGDGGDDKNFLQKGLDWTKEKLGGAWDWTKKKAGQAWNWVKEGTKANVEKVKAFVSNTAETINNSDAANWVRDKIGSEKDDGFIGPKWMNLRNPFAKKEETNVKPETVAVPNGSSYSGPWKPLLDLISSGEGTYDSMYPSESYPEMLDMDIRTELVAFQKQKLKDGRKSVAVGRYQFMYPEVEADRAGLPKGAKFTPENQHKMAIAILEQKRRGKEWMDGKISNAEFSEELAREWGTFKSKSGFVLPGNNGKIDFEQMKPIFEKIKSSGVSPETPDAEKGAILPSTDISMKSHQVQEGSAVVDEIEDQEPPQPIVYLTNSNVSTKPLVIIKKKSNMNDFVEQYRFMSLGAA